MAAIIRAAYDRYCYLYDIRDTRSDDWFMMNSFIYPFGITAGYLYFVLNLGPKLMKNREPLKLDTVIKIYNIIQVICSAFVLERCLSLGWGWEYRWICEPVNYSNTPRGREVLRGVYFYMILKIVDLMDTIFFVLRKKESHVSFLHVYHHAGIFFGSWIIMKYLPGGHGTFIGYINAFVHIIMYSYYFITMTWPEYRKQLWWKKYITQLQMFQFLMVTLHSLPVLFLKHCEYPKPIAGIMVFQYSFMFILFMDFYRKAYKKDIS